MPPLRGVVHAAGITDHAILQRLDEPKLRKVMAPMVQGAWNLHALTRDADLDFFVLFSSAASLLGPPGAANYAAANAFLDALAWHRRAEGRPALSVNWGPWAELGFFTRSELQRYFAQYGVEAMPAADCLRALSSLLASVGYPARCPRHRLGAVAARPAAAAARRARRCNVGRHAGRRACARAGKRPARRAAGCGTGRAPTATRVVPALNSPPAGSVWTHRPWTSRRP